MIPSGAHKQHGVGAPISDAPNTTPARPRLRSGIRARPPAMYSLRHSNIPSRSITVDNVLQYSSDAPSAQRRNSPFTHPPIPVRTPSGRPNPYRVRLTGQLTPQQLPGRSTKVSEKLVLLPEMSSDDKDETDEIGGATSAGARAEEEEAVDSAAEGGEDDFQVDNEQMPLRDDERRRRQGLMKDGVLKGKSYAERLPKARRTEKFSRVTAYCMAQSFRMLDTAKFLKEMHAAKTKLYDDCLYVVYQLPLLPGTQGYRVQSSPVPKTPGGKTVFDEEIERSELRDHDFEEAFGIGSSPAIDPTLSHQHPGESDKSSHSDQKHSVTNPPLSDTLQTAEVFLFTYGVVVFWNLSSHQEKSILADLSLPPSTLPVLPLPLPSLETEEFHFEYSPTISRPRVFNDMITLKSGDHMIKLAISHAIAQSTKLSFFEAQIKERMESVIYIPKRLATTGRLGLQRMDVVKILGGLFNTRVDVNLSSNILEVPGFFWEAEPTLHPLYQAVRDYLELESRIVVLNERCQVFLDLTEVLSDSISDRKTSRQTWIIIVLIVVSIFVTCSEVILRFGMLEKRESSTTVQHGLTFLSDDENVQSSASVRDL